MCQMAFKRVAIYQPAGQYRGGHGWFSEKWVHCTYLCTPSTFLCAVEQLPWPLCQPSPLGLADSGDQEKGEGGNTAIAVTSRQTLGFTGLARNWACHQMSTHTTISRRTMLRLSLGNCNAPWSAIDNRDGLVRPACTSLRPSARMTTMVLSPLGTAACGNAMRHIPNHT